MGSASEERLAIPPEIAEKLVAAADASHRLIEQYRRLAATLYAAQSESGLKKVMVCSALPGEGKTLTATNLALTLSGSYGQRVLLVDADLRNPSVHRMLGIPNSHGLGEYLSTDGAAPQVVEALSGLSVLPAGPVTKNPIAGLVSERMQDVIEDAALRYDWVLLDTPPVGVLTDANLLTGLADAVVFVVAAGSTPYQIAQRAVAAIGAERVLGVVLNKSVETPPETTYYSHYYAATAAKAL